MIIDGLRSPTGIDIGRLHEVLLLAVGLYVVSAALALSSPAWMIAGVVQRLMQRLRAQAEAKVHALPLRHIDQQARGDLLSRVTNDLDNLAQSLQQTMSQMLTSVLLLIGVAVMMFVISPLLAVVALTTVPVSVYGMKVVAARARPRFLAQWGSTGRAQRPDRGGLHRPRHREGVRAPGGGGGAVPTPPTTSSTRRASAPSSCRA